MRRLIDTKAPNVLTVVNYVVTDRNQHFTMLIQKNSSRKRNLEQLGLHISCSAHAQVEAGDMNVTPRSS